MPISYFHLDYPSDSLEDTEGTDCADLDAAQVEAKAVLREMAADHLAAGQLFEPIGISIADEAGDIAARVSVAEAVNEVLPEAGPRHTAPDGS